MAAHRNRFEENVIENNGDAGICILGQTNDLVFVDNVIREIRTQDNQTQSTGIRIGKQAGNVTLNNNKIQAETPVHDQRDVKKD